MQARSAMEREVVATDLSSLWGAQQCTAVQAAGGSQSVRCPLRAGAMDGHLHVHALVGEAAAFCSHQRGATATSQTQLFFPWYY